MGDNYVVYFGYLNLMQNISWPGQYLGHYMILRSLIKWLSWISNANWYCGQCWVWVPAAHLWRGPAGLQAPGGLKVFGPSPRLWTCRSQHASSFADSGLLSSHQLVKCLQSNGWRSRRRQKPQASRSHFHYHALRTKRFAVKMWAWLPHASRWVTVNSWDMSEEVLTLRIYSHMLPWTDQILDLHCGWNILWFIFHFCSLKQTSYCTLMKKAAPNPTEMMEHQICRTVFSHFYIF